MLKMSWTVKTAQVLIDAKNYRRELQNWDSLSLLHIFGWEAEDAEYEELSETSLQLLANPTWGAVVLTSSVWLSCILVDGGVISQKLWE
jgi:hypothetical protein